MPLTPPEQLITAIELHDVKMIRNCFEKGVDPNSLYNGEPLLYELTSEYTRSPRFKECVTVFVEAGLQMEDRALLAVLQDDGAGLDQILLNDFSVLNKEYTLRCAYTPLYKVSLLHICAEFNHVACARVLDRHGADINAEAGKDEHGFGGQTPVFHTVNQNGNQSAEMLYWLLEKQAALHITLPGLIWGKGYPWETLIAGVNPVNYAQMGLLPQMHRDEKTVYDTVSLLVKHAYGIDYRPGNLPNAYLQQ